MRLIGNSVLKIQLSKFSKKYSRDQWKTKDIILHSITFSAPTSIHNSQNQIPITPSNRNPNPSKSSKLVRTHLRSGKKGEGWVCKRRGGADTRPLDDTIVHKISRKCMLFRLASWRAVTYMVGIYYESSPVKAAAVWRLFRTRSFPTCL